MRFPLLALASLLSFFSTAQDLPSDLDKMPAWMVTLLTDQKPSKPYKPQGKPLHTNKFIGTWAVRTAYARRYEGWSDADRIVIREFDGPFTLQSALLIDLQANIKLKVRWGGLQPRVEIEDLYIPRGGYFMELFNDTVIPAGKTERIMGVECTSLIGTNSNRDTTWYWKTDIHPTLFADLEVWSRWLCRDGDLEYLSAFSDKNAGGSLKVSWRGRQYATREQGSMTFTAITPGAVPMPEFDLTPSTIAENRRLWTNNTRLGRVPDWMRASINPLPPHPLPVAYTPPALERNIPDNRFIGTFTAETRTLEINEHKDTTERVAIYSYWADARRAVLRLDDPDDEGHIAYMVDLDADVVVLARDEKNSALPRLYITSLEEVGLNEFGNGIELDLQPQGKYHTFAGRKCELHIAPDRMLRFFWIPQKPLLNPIFDIKNWIAERPAHDFQDVMFFGLADRSMPMAVMGTSITSYKPGKSDPPVLDLTNHGIRDQRLKDRGDGDRQADRIEVRTIDINDIHGDLVAVPDMEPVAVEEMPTDIKAGEDPSPPVMEGRWEDVAIPPPIEDVPVEHVTIEDYPVPDTPVDPSLLIPAELKSYLDHPTNRFMGSAFLNFSSKKGDKIKVWDIQYYSTAEKSVLISKGHGPLQNPRTGAWVIDRKTGTEQIYSLGPDSTLFKVERKLDTAYTAMTESFMLDKPAGNKKEMLGRTCIQRRFEDEMFLRDAWMDTTTPSIYLDLFSARKTWEGLDQTIFGNRLGIADRSMPLEVDLYWRDENIRMRVISVTQGPIDTGMFTITKETFRQ
ncbi:MAG: hypothetical protein JNL43_04400 [Flavobacteriales bacterium]|nr:hypothetical protein [Flavobacteriales bacterium]